MTVIVASMLRHFILRWPGVWGVMARQASRYMARGFRVTGMFIVWLFIWMVRVSRWVGAWGAKTQSFTWTGSPVLTVSLSYWRA